MRPAEQHDLRRDEHHVHRGVVECAQPGVQPDRPSTVHDRRHLQPTRHMRRGPRRGSGVQQRPLRPGQLLRRDDLSSQVASRRELHERGAVRVTARLLRPGEPADVWPSDVAAVHDPGTRRGCSGHRHAGHRRRWHGRGYTARRRRHAGRLRRPARGVRSGDPSEHVRDGDLRLLHPLRTGPTRVCGPDGPAVRRRSSDRAHRGLLCVRRCDHRRPRELRRDAVHRVHRGARQCGLRPGCRRGRMQLPRRRSRRR